MGQNDHALVVGINSYPALSNLQGPEADATEFADWLKTDPRVQVPANQVTVVLSSSFPPAGPNKAQPMVSDIDAELSAHVNRADLDGGSAGERLYLYFAGHGIAPDADEVALLMANAAQRQSGQHVPGRSYMRWFREASMFKEIVLFMDCCREPTLQTPPRFPPWDRRLVQGKTNCLVGFATGWPSVARETITNPGSPVRGVFTQILLDGLKGGAPLNARGELTSSMLEGFVLDRFKKLYQENQGQVVERQQPDIDSDPKDTFVVLRGAAPLGVAPVLTVVRIRRADGGAGDEILVFDNAGKRLPGSARDGVLETDLRVGWYKATAPGPTKLLFEVSEPGGTLDVIV